MKLLAINPNPRLVWLMNYAIDEIVVKLSWQDRFEVWLTWAASWKAGERSPGICVDVAHRCFAHKGDPAWHCLGQLAWGAKEACYDNPTSGWLVIRYIADAMVAFGLAFPTTAEIPLLDASVSAIEPRP